MIKDLNIEALKDFPRELVTRELWLKAAVSVINEVIFEGEMPDKDFQINVGRVKSKKTLGECLSPKEDRDEFFPTTIHLSEKIDNPQEIIGVLIHECIHCFYEAKSHGKFFSAVAYNAGLIAPFKEYNPSHRVAGAGDVSLGVGLDSSTTVFIDFDTMPAQVIGTYYNNEIKPDDFGDEMARQGRMFGECLLAPENNNAGVATIARLKQIYPMSRIYATQKNEQGIKYTVPNTFGWNTNALTKGQMFNDLSKAVEDGLIELNDPDLIAEARSYSRNDLMDRDVDVRLVTRHYDILTSCAIAWQMKDYAVRASARKELNTIDKLFIKAKKDDGGSSFE